MSYTLDEATTQANEFLSGIYGAEDSRQPDKAAELATLLMAAHARGGAKVENSKAKPKLLAKVLHPRAKVSGHPRKAK